MVQESTEEKRLGRRKILIGFVESTRGFLPKLRCEAADTKQDPRGVCAGGLASGLRSLGVAEYVVNHDIATLRSCLRESVQLYSSLFDRFELGEPIDPSYIAMLAYKALYDALAIGEWALAEALARKMGGRDALERKYDHSFDRAMGYCLRAFVLGDREEMRGRLEAFSAECEKKKNANDRGYALVFAAILQGDSAKVNAGFAELLKGHRRLCKGNRVFQGTEYEDLCVWGLGLANLAKHRGLQVAVDDPLLPAELII